MRCISAWVPGGVSRGGGGGGGLVVLWLLWVEVVTVWVEVVVVDRGGGVGGGLVGVKKVNV